MEKFTREQVVAILAKAFEASGTPLTAPHITSTQHKLYGLMNDAALGDYRNDCLDEGY
jgi:hypothetical protein